MHRPAYRAIRMRIPSHSVCLDLLVQPVCASCGHDFCKVRVVWPYNPRGLLAPCTTQFCYEAWVRESRLDSPVCPVCRQDISAVCPGVCRRMEATINVLFPEKLVARAAEVELHKRQHAELQAVRDAQHLRNMRGLYSRILSLIERVHATRPERSQSRGAAPGGAPGGALGPASQDAPGQGAASEANMPDEDDDGEDPMDASSLARTLDSFMNTSMSANALQDGGPVLTLVRCSVAVVPASNLYTTTGVYDRSQWRPHPPRRGRRRAPQPDHRSQKGVAPAMGSATRPGATAAVGAPAQPSECRGTPAPGGP